MTEYKLVDVTEECEVELRYNASGQYLWAKNANNLRGDGSCWAGGKSDMYRWSMVGEDSIIRIEKRVEVEPFKCPLEHPETECPVLDVTNTADGWTPELGDEVKVDWCGNKADWAIIRHIDDGECLVFAPKPRGNGWHGGISGTNPVPGMMDNHLYVYKRNMTLIKKVSK